MWAGRIKVDTECCTGLPPIADLALVVGGNWLQQSVCDGSVAFTVSARTGGSVDVASITATEAVHL